MLYYCYMIRCAVWVLVLLLSQHKDGDVCAGKLEYSSHFLFGDVVQRVVIAGYETIAHLELLIIGTGSTWQYTLHLGTTDYRLNNEITQ